MAQQKLMKMPKSHLGSVADRVKHRLAKESLANGHPIQASHQLILLPSLKRMGKSHVMKPTIGLQDVICNPRAILPFTRSRGTMLHHRTESRIDAHLEPATSQCVPQRFANLHLTRTNHEPRIERPPKNRLPLIVPRENAIRVCHQQSQRREVAPYGQQAVWLSQLSRGKTIIVFKKFEYQIFFCYYF